MNRRGLILKLAGHDLRHPKISPGFRYLNAIMSLNRRTKFYVLAFLKHDLKASVSVFFVALPVCLGISLFTLTEKNIGHIKHYSIELALNVSFLNKGRFLELLDEIPEYSMVDTNGTKSIYIDNDILEIFHDFRSKAHNKHIQLSMKDIPDVETIELH